MCNDPKLAEEVLEWSAADKYSTPMSIGDFELQTSDFEDLLHRIGELCRRKIAKVAFPAELQEAEDE